MIAVKNKQEIIFTMNLTFEQSCEFIRQNFENKICLYVEKGVWIARMSQIEIYQNHRIISAIMEEIPHPGFGKSRLKDGKNLPYCWELRIGEEIYFNKQYLSYTGLFSVEIFFSPKIIEISKSLVAELNWEKDPFAPYEAILNYTYQIPYIENTKLVFPSDEQDGPTKAN